MKNVVFDFGQVLVRFEPTIMVGRYVKDGEDARLLASVLFDRLYWDKLDAGTIEDEEVMRLARERLPERLWEVADKIYYNWIYNIPEIEGMRELLLDLKKRNVKVFVLSNICTYFASHEDEIPILSLVDKKIYSSICGLAKPDKRIFEYACQECGIEPKDTVFVDDRLENVESAESIGMTGYVFDGNADKLREVLEKLLDEEEKNVL